MIVLKPTWTLLGAWLFALEGEAQPVRKHERQSCELIELQFAPVDSLEQCFRSPERPERNSER